MNTVEKKMYEGLLPKNPIGGHLGYYPVCSAEEWRNLPLPYKVMEWVPVKDHRDGGRLKPVKAVIFDVTYMEPYKVSAKVSVHPQEVQKVLFCLHKDPQCLLYSVCGVELEGGTQLGAKWLQDSISGAFAIVAGGQYVGQQGGFRGLIPEKVQRLEDGSFEYEWHKQGATKTSHYELSNPFAHQRPEKDTVEKLMDAMAEFAEESAWTDNEYIEALVQCGIEREDFEKYGKGDLVKDYFMDKGNEAVAERSLDELIQEAEFSGRQFGEVIRNAMNTAMRDGYEQFVYTDGLGGYSFSRSADGKPVVPLYAPGEKIVGKVRFKSNQRDVEFVPVEKNEVLKQKGQFGEKQVIQDFGEREFGER